MRGDNWANSIWLCGALVALSSTLASGQAPGFAPPAPTAPPAAASGATSGPLAQALRGQALTDYQAARILFDDGDYAGASLKFQHAFDESKDARLLWNIAVCEKNQRHYAAVLRLVERYSLEISPIMSPEHRAEVEEVLATVRTLVSSVRVNVDQPEVAVFLDGVPVGTTPLMEPLLIDLGRHSIALKKADFEDQVIAQDFAGNSYTVFEISMRRLDSRGKLRVIAQAGASIRIDGNLMGEGDWHGALPAGRHALRVSAEGMRDYTKDVSITAGQEHTLYVTLEEPESGVPAWVWVSAGVVVAGGLATGGYFLFRSPEKVDGVTGSLASVDINP